MENRHGELKAANRPEAQKLQMTWIEQNEGLDDKSDNKNTLENFDNRNTALTQVTQLQSKNVD